MTETTSRDRPSVEFDVLVEADRLVGAGRHDDAVDLLATANRLERDPRLDLRLLDLRLSAAAARSAGPGRSPWPPVIPDPFPEVTDRLPEIAAADLDDHVLGGAVAHHGCLIVRDVFDADQVARGIETIDRVEARRDGNGRVDTSEVDDPDAQAWFRPVVTDTQLETAVERQMVARQGGTWLADSPAAAGRVLDQLTSVGVVDAIGRHLGERPYISLQKSTLRLSAPVWNWVAWHQDGSFLDPEVRTMNVWVALTACGGDLPTPGMEIIPRRFDEILEVDPAWSKHAIPFETIDELLEETPSVIPEFGPGDALMFDEHCVHRTHLPQEMDRPRYALECWFFAPSHQSSNYTPLLV